MKSILLLLMSLSLLSALFSCGVDVDTGKNSELEPIKQIQDDKEADDFKSTEGEEEITPPAIEEYQETEPLDDLLIIEEEDESITEEQSEIEEEALTEKQAQNKGSDSQENNSDSDSEKEDESNTQPNGGIKKPIKKRGANLHLLESGSKCLDRSLKMPRYIANFCAKIPKSYASKFSELHAGLCRNGKYINLFSKDCGYDGSRSSFHRNYKLTREINSMTTMTIRSQQAFITKQSRKDYLEVKKSAYRNMKQFREKGYRAPSVLHLSDYRPSADGSMFRYTFAVKAVGLTSSFSGQSNIIELTPNVTIVFATSVDNLKMFKFFRSIEVLIERWDGSTQVVKVTKTSARDFGMHDTVHRAFRDFDMEMMQANRTNINR